MTTTAPVTKTVFAAEHDVPIPYMQRTRDYYQALGFSPYRWAHYIAAPFQPELGEQGPGAPYNAAAKFYKVYSLPSESVPDLRISHVGYDRLHTTAADVNTYLPLARLKDAVAAGRIGALGPRLHGTPTNRSQRVTIEIDSPE